MDEILHPKRMKDFSLARVARMSVGGSEGEGRELLRNSKLIVLQDLIQVSDFPLIKDAGCAL